MTISNRIMELKHFKFLLLLPVMLMVYLPPTAQAQLTELLSQVENPDVPDTLRGWDVRWNVSLNGAQASYSNWSKGGSNSISVNSNSLLRFLYKRNLFAYEFRIRGRYGQTRIQDDGVRKTDDRLMLRHRFLFDLSEDHDEFKIFGNIDFETQFDKGYNFGGGPDGGNLLISDFMSPAYMVQNTGLAYYPDDSFSMEAGFGLKQTIVRDESLATRYGLDEGKNLKSEAGFTFGLNYEQDVLENVTYTGYIETFSNLNKHVTRTDIFITNELEGKINSYLNATFRLDLIYNENYSEKWQVGQLLSAGLSVNIF
ncbi:MAG: DUF3078 domain-containing protein [Balneolaceae bacterium]